MRQSLKIFKIFNALALKQVYWKMKAFFKKLEYRFSVETTAIESAIFLYKTALSKAYVKTNRMGTKKWIYQNECSFATNYNDGHNILRIFGTLPLVLSTTSQTKRDY